VAVSGPRVREGKVVGSGSGGEEPGARLVVGWWWASREARGCREEVQAAFFRADQITLIYKPWTVWASRFGGPPALKECDRGIGAVGVWSGWDRDNTRPRCVIGYN